MAKLPASTIVRLERARNLLATIQGDMEYYKIPMDDRENLMNSRYYLSKIKTNNTKRK